MQQSWKKWFYFFLILKVLQDLATKIGIAKLSCKKIHSKIQKDQASTELIYWK